MQRTVEGFVAHIPICIESVSIPIQVKVNIIEVTVECVCFAIIASPEDQITFILPPFSSKVTRKAFHENFFGIIIEEIYIF